MLKRSHQTLAEAKLLFDCRQSFRACISRAFLAMFYATQALLFCKNLTVSTHNGTVSLFTTHFVQPGLVLPGYGKFLGIAFSMRLKADHDYSAEFEENDAREFLENATDFIQTMETWLKNNLHL